MAQWMVPVRRSLALSLLLALPGAALPAEISERVMVRFSPGKSADGESLLKAAGAKVHVRLDWMDTLAVSLPPEAIEVLREQPEVLAVEPDPVRRSFAQQVPYGITLVDSTNLWSSGATGSNVLICVIDSGINATHEDLVGNISGGSPAGWDSDACGHGTHVAGTAAARNNTLGVVGVAHAASLYVVKIFSGDAQSCGSAFSSNILSAAQQCASAGSAQNKRVVINLSLGGSGSSSIESSGFASLYNTGANLIVAAAGNDGTSNLSYPASYDSVISVGAVNSTKALAAFSQRNAQVELVAPGVGIQSTYPSAGGVNPANGYAMLSGTSMASPHVAGVAAAIWSRSPQRTAAEVRSALTSTAEDLGTPGRDPEFGFGLVRGLSALTALQPSDTMAPSTPAGLAAALSGNTAVNLSWSASSDSGSGVQGYKIERCTGSTCSSFAQIGTATSNSYRDTGIAAGNTYRYRVRAHDVAGNHSAYSSIISATTAGAGADTSAPSAPGSPSLKALSSTSMTLSWRAAADIGSGVASYRIERCQNTGCTNFTQIATSSSLSYTATGLTVRAVYRFRVRAVDRAGNLGAYSAIVQSSAQTTAISDRLPPGAPGGLSATASSGTAIALRWTAATDAGGSGVGSYRVERCQGSTCTNFTQVITTSATTITVSGLAARTPYRFRVRAVDRANNLGAYSSIASATTL
ncbi:S8 family serine peptidase [Pseudomarimonas salicorniae]|uniref:S8 family serine peptidase n=1 Tax=Pseudomarimonas salicorniae TaxID=2933270 RepID=A0ABT0GKS4_9GAMM|nr:S8 family serine peptidase [Lysobacter sp. CAU 1642]MCK7595160.1 S8 family serine peptidase [Lysobacter sp. CAU 1642]